MIFYKKSVLIAFVAFVAVCNAAPDPRIDVNGVLRDRIEDFRRQMPCGINGSPPLAPFVADYLSLDINDPMMISTGHVTNLTVTGLDGFIVDVLDFNLFRMRLEYSITLPELNVAGNYKINATAMEVFEIWGEGPFSLTLFNSNVRGFMHLNIVRGYLNLRDLDATLTLERVESNIEGILGDEESTDFYNQLLEQIAPWMIDENRVAISAAIRESLMPLINGVLNQLTLADLIGRQAKLDAKSEALQCEFPRM